MSLSLVLAIVALILALIEEFRSQGQSLVGWAVVALSLIFILAGRIG